MMPGMRAVVWTLLATGIGWGLVLGCAEDPDRPGGVDPCAGDAEGCGNPQTGENGAGGSAGSTSSPSLSAGAGGETALTGTVLEYTDDQFLYVTEFAGEAEVFADGPNGETVLAAYDGANAFLLEDVLATHWGWVGVQPVDSASDLLPTLHPVDTTSGGALELPMARASVVDLILRVGTSPLERDVGAAQLVLRFVDESGLALPGITVETSDPTQPILFRDGSNWSDTDTETLADGLALLPNLAAFELPGGTIPVTFSEGTESFVLQPRVAQGAVTVMTVLVAP